MMQDASCFARMAQTDAKFRFDSPRISPFPGIYIPKGTGNSSGTFGITGCGYGYEVALNVRIYALLFPEEIGGRRPDNKSEAQKCGVIQ